jgi:hypothetical protein
MISVISDWVLATVRTMGWLSWLLIAPPLRFPSPALFAIFISGQLQ